MKKGNVEMVFELGGIVFDYGIRELGFSAMGLVFFVMYLINLRKKQLPRLHVLWLCFMILTMIKVLILDHVITD